MVKTYKKLILTICSLLLFACTKSNNKLTTDTVVKNGGQSKDFIKNETKTQKWLLNINDKSFYIKESATCTWNTSKQETKETCKIESTLEVISHDKKQIYTRSYNKADEQSNYKQSIQHINKGSTDFILNDNKNEYKIVSLDLNKILEASKLEHYFSVARCRKSKHWKQLVEMSALNTGNLTIGNPYLTSVFDDYSKLTTLLEFDPYDFSFKGLSVVKNKYSAFIENREEISNINQVEVNKAFYEVRYLNYEDVIVMNNPRRFSNKIGYFSILCGEKYNDYLGYSTTRKDLFMSDKQLRIKEPKIYFSYYFGPYYDSNVDSQLYLKFLDSNFTLEDNSLAPESTRIYLLDSIWLEPKNLKGPLTGIYFVKDQLWSDLYE